MAKITEIITKQHNIGIWWGALRNTVSNATMYLSLFNTVLLVPTAYVTWVQPWCESNGIEFPFWLFIVVIFVIGCLVLLVEYKLFTPSNFEFWASQFWKHGGNPLQKQLEEQEMRLKSIEDKLEKLVNRN